MKEKIAFTRFKLEIPEGKILRRISKEYPDLSFNILSLLPIGKKTGSCSLQIKGKSLIDYRKKLIQLIKSFDLKAVILGNIPGYILLNLQIKDPWILEAIIKIELMIHYPLEIKNGFISFQLISDRKKIDNLFDEFDTKKLDYNLIEIGYYRPETLLTPNQDQVLKDAVKLGYYEIPREISLTNMAKKYNISASALSETFRRIDKKLAQYYLRGSKE